MDVTSGVPPKQFIRGEWFVTTALLTAAVWIVLNHYLGNSDSGLWASSIIAFAVGFAFRLLALYRCWEEPLAKEPTGTYQHSDGRPLLGRKLAGKSKRELNDLGLEVQPPNPEAQ